MTVKEAHTEIIITADDFPPPVPLLRATTNRRKTLTAKPWQRLNLGSQTPRLDDAEFWPPVPARRVGLATFFRKCYVFLTETGIPGRVLVSQPVPRILRNIVGGTTSTAAASSVVREWSES